MGLLADIFSYGDTQKRRIRGLLDDPAGTLGLGATRAVEDQDGLLNLFANAYPMAGDKTVLNTPDQRKQMQAEAAGKALETYGGLLGATVWHGSPHKFDKFDASKIGTGEGAQAYGHGLYLAESPDVAKAYQSQLARTDFTYADDAARAQMKNATNFDDFVWGVIDRFSKENAADPKATAAALRAYADRYSSGREAIKKAADLMGGGRMAPTEAGALYKVDLPDEAIARMLDWDKPLSQQASEVLQGILDSGAFQGKSIEQLKGLNLGKVGGDATGEYAWLKMLNQMSNGNQFKKADSAKGLAEKLRNAGIPGIRYLDGGSRDAGQGSSNYVVFPGGEGLLSILERNGLPIK